MRTTTRTKRTKAGDRPASDNRMSLGEALREAAREMGDPELIEWADALAAGRREGEAQTQKAPAV